MAEGSADELSWPEEVWSQVASHIRAEDGIASDYAALAASVEDPELRYLIDLIMEDEARHHRVLTELANALRGAIQWHSIDHAVPRGSRRPLSPELRAATRRFIEIEKDDARQLRDLRRRLRPLGDTTAWRLILELMALDTEKHLRILRFVARQRR